MSKTLPKSKITWIPVLTVDECKLLRKVKTPKTFARLILKRNLPMLKALEKGEDYHGDVGCPHCIAVATDNFSITSSGCAKCAWNIPELPKQWGYHCCDATFGGVCMSEAEAVDYCCRSEDVRSDYMSYNDVVFIRGHIEWAEHVLGITPWPEGVE